MLYLVKFPLLTQVVVSCSGEASLYLINGYKQLLLLQPMASHALIYRHKMLIYTGCSALIWSNYCKILIISHRAWQLVFDKIAISGHCMRVYYGLCMGCENWGRFQHNVDLHHKKSVGYNMCRSRQGPLGLNVPHFIITTVLCAKLVLTEYYWCSNDPVYLQWLSRHHDYIPDDLILHLHTMMYVIRITKIATSKMSWIMPIARNADICTQFWAEL